MSKRPKDGDEGRWPTPSEEYGITQLPILPGDQRESRDDHEAVSTETKVGSIDDDSFIFDITENNYIDWSDICVKETSTQVKLEDINIKKAIRDLSRTSPKTTNETSATAEGHNTILEKESTCPIPTCKKRTKKLKHHCWDYHLPFIFKDKVEETLENDPEFQQLRAEALTMLATWIYKRKSTPFDLVRFINNTPDFIPNNCNMMARCQDQMRNLTKAMNWLPPRNDVYTMYPVNHPSVLIQWQILITLVTHGQRAQFRRLGRNYVPQDRRDRSRVMFTSVRNEFNKRPRGMSCTSEKTHVTKQARVVKSPDTLKIRDARDIINKKRPAEQANYSVTDSQHREKSRRVEESSTSDGNNNIHIKKKTTTIHKAFDSHFHLDRASILSKGSLQLTIEEYLETDISSSPEIPVEITGGVLVYCDPDTFLNVFPDTTKWKIAVGLHPKAAPYFTQEQFELIREKLCDDRIVGLDRSCNAVTWVSQEKVFERLLGLANPNKPVIIHVRGERKGNMSEDVYKRALEIVKSNCEPEQKIQLHSFHGGVKQVQEWRRNFPNTYFSFSMLCKGFNREQKQGLIAVPEHRLLLETDSPYLSLTSDIQANQPRYLGNVALIVAGLREMPIAGTLAITMENGRGFFS